MVQIEPSIENLIQKISDCSIEELKKILDNTPLPNFNWEKYSSWEEGRYTRNCLARTEDFEVILLCWEAHVRTPIHNHAGQDCWVYQVQGNLKEVRYLQQAENEFTIKCSNEFNPGDKAYIKDEIAWHTIENEGTARSISLHVYAKPIDSCLIYDEETGRTVEKELCYAGED